MLGLVSKKCVKYYQVILLCSVLVFSSCSSKQWDLSSDKFAHSNLLRFDGSDAVLSELEPVNDVEFLKQCLDDKYWETDYYYYSWQTTKSRNFTEFTLVESHECGNNVHYIIMDSKGKLINNFIVSDQSLCMGEMFYSSSEFSDESTFVKHDYKRDWHTFGYTLKASQTLTDGKIDAEGKVSYAEPLPINSAVCLWEKLTIKATPAVSGEYKTSVLLGESFFYLGETVVDNESGDKIEYGKVKLSDGTEGWIQNRYTAIKAIPGVVSSDAYIYNRADEITKTDKQFKKFDILAIVEITEDEMWYKVKGKPSNEKWFKEGWVKGEHVNVSEINISVANLIHASLKLNDPNEQKKQLLEILDHPTFEHSIFLAEIKEMAGLTREKSKNPQDIIARIGTSWVALTEHNNEWVIYNECHYGSGGISFHEDGSYISFSGGGDQWGYNIDKMEETDDGIYLQLSSEYEEGTEERAINIYIDENNVMFFYENDMEERYVFHEDTASIKTINEECDE